MQVRIHPSLARFVADGEMVFNLEAVECQGLLNLIFKKHPKLKAAIVSQDQTLHGYINIYINGQHYRNFAPHHSLSTHDQIDVMSSLIGG